MSVLDQSVVSGLLDAVRRMCDQNDEVIALLQHIAAQQVRLTSSQDKTMELVAMLVAASLNSAPRVTIPYVVPTTQVVLAENQSEPLMMIEISNHDPAQALQLGNDGVTIIAGHEVAPGTTVPFELPLGRRLFGICTAATINVSVAIMYPPFDLVKAIKESLQWTQT